MPGVIGGILFYLKLNAFLMLEVIVWLALALLLFALCKFVWPGLVRESGSRLSRLTRSGTWPVLIPVVLFVGMRLSILPLVGAPQPGLARDEFSYLLGADTFASGRLANPTHPLWRHFDSPHIIQVPTYSSKYPPAQALLLAAGQVLLGRPWAGVVLGMACFIAALGWALRGWLPPKWALLGTLLVVFRIGLVSYWVNSYFGGVLAAGAGALVLGAVGRLRGAIRTRDMTLLAAGLVLLATTRPFEGVCAAIPLMIGLSPSLYRAWAGKQRKRLLLPVLTSGALLCGSFVWLAFYNYRVTGNPARMPYQVWFEQYSEAPYFLWHGEKPKVLPNAGLRAYADFENVEMKAYRSPVVRILSALKILTAFYWGPVIAGAVILSARAVFLRRRWRLPVVATGISIVMMYGVGPFFWSSHYVAPFACAFVLLGTASLRAVYLWLCAALRRRAAATQTTRAIAPAICVSSLLAMLVLVPVGLRLRDSSYAWTLPSYSGRGWCCEPNLHQRHTVESRLLQLPGNHLVMVRRSTSEAIGTDWYITPPRSTNPGLCGRTSYRRRKITSSCVTLKAGRCGQPKCGKPA